MANLNLENITKRFCELTHLTPAEAENYGALISSSKSSFEKLLKSEPAEEAVPLCEYACGCAAFYDYTVLSAAEEKNYSSSSGGMSARKTSDFSVKSAEALYRLSLAALPDGLINDRGFSFEGVRG